MLKRKLNLFLVAAAALAITSSPLLAAPKVGDKAPAFKLKDAVSGKEVSLDSLKGKTVVLEWFNKDCPFVRKHYDKPEQNMQTLQGKYAGEKVAWVTIATGDSAEPVSDAKKTFKSEESKATAFLLDTKGTVGEAYGARTTPQMFIINPEGVVVYTGGIDNKKSAEKADIKDSKNYVAAALDEMAAGKTITDATTEPYGCSVKYKKKK